MSDSRRNWSIALIALCALYCSLRIWRITDSCLWFDEIFSVHVAEHEWGSLLWFVAQDLIHPPLFYSILKLWIGAGGESVFWLRLLPVIFACLALIPFYLLCGELKLENRVIAFALFLFAINGTFIKYAQSVRMYSLLMLLSLVSLWLFARYFNRGKNLTALAIVNLFMVYTHYYGCLVVGCEIAAVFIFQRFKWRGMAVMSGVLGVLFMPWIWFVWKASQSGSDLSQNISWILRPGFAEVGTYLIDLTEPFYFQTSSAEPASNYFVSIPLLLIFAAAAALFASRFRALSTENKRSVYFLSVFSLLPIVIVFILSWILPYSIWGTRHLIIVAGPSMLLAGTILDKFGQGRLRITFVTLIALLSTLAFVVDTTRIKQEEVWCAWEGTAMEIVSNTPGDEKAKIYTFEDLVAYHVWFATRKSDRVEIEIINGVEGMQEDRSYFLPRGFENVNRATIDEIEDEKALLLFRTGPPGQEANLKERIKALGYLICPTTPTASGKTGIFKLEIVRSERDCGG